MTNPSTDANNTTNSSPTLAAPPVQKLSTNVSDHSAMTTPLNEEHEPSHPPSPAVVKPAPHNLIVKTEKPHILSAPAKLNLGALVAEGGFCCIYEITAIKNEDNGEWILEPAKSTSPKRHKRGVTAFTLGAKPPSNRRMGHKRGGSMSALLQSPKNTANDPLPPLIQSVQVTVVAPFLSPEAVSSAMAANATAANNSSGGFSPFRRSKTTADSPSKAAKSVFRRSHSNEFSSPPAKSTVRKSRELAQRTMQQAPPYVLKCLKPAAFNNKQILEMGLKDMEIEIDTLQKLHHPNIVSVLAHGTMVLEGVHDHSTPYPFVILDRLGETLENKLVYWEAKHQKNTTFVGKMVTHRNYSKVSYCARERWQILKDMAAALAYMHSQRYVL